MKKNTETRATPMSAQGSKAPSVGPSTLDSRENLSHIRLLARSRFVPSTIFPIKSKTARSCKSRTFLLPCSCADICLKSMFNAHMASYVSHEQLECIYPMQERITHACVCVRVSRDFEYTGCTKK